MKIRKWVKKEIKYSNYPLFLCQQGFKQNPAGEIIFQQKDKILLLPGIYSNPECSLVHNVLNLPTVETSAVKWFTALEFNYLSAVLNSSFWRLHHSRSSDDLRAMWKPS